MKACANVVIRLILSFRMSQSVCGNRFRDTYHFKKSDKSSSRDFVVIKKIAWWNVRSVIDHDMADCPERRSVLISLNFFVLELTLLRYQK